MNINPADFLINLKGKPYLPVAGRIAIVRAEGKPYSIKTTPLQIDMEQGFAVFQAEVWLDGILLGMGTKQESKRDFPDFLEKAETGAIGRALAISGFGTIYALQDFDEGDRLADAPVTVNKSSQPPSPAPAPAPPKAPPGQKSPAHAFRDAVAFHEGMEVTPARLKKVHRILTGSDERTDESLSLATRIVKDCADRLELEALLAKHGVGEDAPF